MQPKNPTSFTGKARESLAKILDHVLRDECSLSATTRDYRWNVTGPNLYSLHRLFDEQRRQLDYWLGRVIERAKAAGLAAVNLGDAPPATGAGLPPDSMIEDLLARHEAMARQLREDIARLGDPGTAELLARLIDFHETAAWMLRMLHDGLGAGSDRRA